MSTIPGHRTFLAALLWSLLLCGSPLPLGAEGPVGRSAPGEDPSAAVSPEERLAIERSLPGKAIVTPSKARKLLIFDLNVGYPGHGSIKSANLAFSLMGSKTGAFETVLSRDPQVFQRDSLKRFDAVFLNNTVGNLFTDPRLRQSLVEFVVGGGGLLGVHGTTVAFTQWPAGAIEDWPEFGILLGGRGARHRESDERVIVKLDDPDHPLNGSFSGKGFEYRDEFFRVDGPYSRDRVRVLLSIDTEKTDLKAASGGRKAEREDNDYALAWVRSYGKGRVFYCTIAHNPRVFADPSMLQFYLGAIQFALGDLSAPTLPSARMTPASKAEEALGWRLGVAPYSFNQFTFFEAIDKTAQLAIPYMGSLSFQKVSAGIPKDLDDRLTDEEIQQVRLKLDAAGVRLLTYYFHQIPGDAAGCRKIFEFGRKLGIETFISEPLPESLDTIEGLCNEYGINLAIHNHGKDLSPNYWNPEGVLKACRNRGKRIGACGDMGYWMRSGIDPIEAVRLLGDRTMALDLHDLDARSPEGHDVPWGTGAGGTERFLQELHKLGIRPILISLEYSYNFLDSLGEMARCADFFHQAVLKMR